MFHNPFGLHCHPIYLIISKNKFSFGCHAKDPGCSTIGSGHHPMGGKQATGSGTLLLAFSICNSNYKLQH
jgi:hypothetical protein